MWSFSSIFSASSKCFFRLVQLFELGTDTAQLEERLRLFAAIVGRQVHDSLKVAPRVGRATVGDRPDT